MTKRLFSLGDIVSTPAAIEALEEANAHGIQYLQRHVTGDWGDLEPEDVKENELSVKQGFRILSVYVLPTGVRIWIITEADRSSTTILLPSDY